MKLLRCGCRPHFHQHAGFHVVQSATLPPLTHVDSPPPHVGSWNPSSSAAAAASGHDAAASALTAVALTHYGAARSTLAGAVPALADALPPFPASVVRVVEAALSSAGAKATSALEIGAGVGGVSFRLAEVFGRVTAIERDARMVALAQRLQADGSSVLGCDPMSSCAQRTARPLHCSPVAHAGSATLRLPTHRGIGWAQCT